MRSDSKAIRLVNQQVYSLSALQHPFDVLGHNASHVIDLVLNIAYRIFLTFARCTIIYHQIFQRRIERSAAICRQFAEICLFGRIFGEETILDLHEEAKRHSATEAAVRDNQESETTGRSSARWILRRGRSDVVDKVLVVGVRKFLRLGVRDLRKNERRQGRCL